MRTTYLQQLEQLNNEIIEMGAIVEDSISGATDALLEQNATLAEKVIQDETLSDNKEKEIENLCMKLLLHQQPVATDLRYVSAALKMITDMERIGDQAKDIALIVKYLSGKKYIKELVDIPAMAEATKKMLSDSIDAFITKDIDKAIKAIAYDDVVDNLFLKVRKDLIRLVHENHANGEQALDLFMIAKYFERIGDHATNIAEWVIYMITGTHRQDEEIDDPREDDTPSYDISYDAHEDREDDDD
ncbi:MAG: phosphate signaling complex protein PhoU [Oscillospiraceae bacterium]|nr:phosphate signaling complex protein PhoU [Oscillospiraceae bacterium]